MTAAEDDDATAADAGDAAKAPRVSSQSTASMRKKRRRNRTPADVFADGGYGSSAASAKGMCGSQCLIVLVAVGPKSPPFVLCKRPPTHHEGAKRE